MRADIERTIMRYYPAQRLESPLEHGVPWDWDPDHARLQSLLQDLEGLDPSVRSGTGGGYVVGEEVVLAEGLRLQLSYLGPYAALVVHPSHKLSEVQADMVRQLRSTVDKHGFELLDEGTLQEPAAWLEVSGARATVRTCLFEGPRDLG